LGRDVVHLRCRFRLAFRVKPLMSEEIPIDAMTRAVLSRIGDAAQHTPSKYSE
jgi:hypothetical protein